MYAKQSASSIYVSDSSEEEFEPLSPPPPPPPPTPNQILMMNLKSRSKFNEEMRRQHKKDIEARAKKWREAQIKRDQMKIQFVDQIEMLLGPIELRPLTEEDKERFKTIVELLKKEKGTQLLNEVQQIEKLKSDYEMEIKVHKEANQEMKKWAEEQLQTIRDEYNDNLADLRRQYAGELIDAKNGYNYDLCEAERSYRIGLKFNWETYKSKLDLMKDFAYNLGRKYNIPQEEFKSMPRY